MTMGQYWLGKTKPKQALRSTQNAFKKLLRNFWKNYLNEVYIAYLNQEVQHRGVVCSN